MRFQLSESIAWILIIALAITWGYLRFWVFRDVRKSKPSGPPLEEALNALRKRTKRDIPKAVGDFVLAIIYACLAYGQGITIKVGDRTAVDQLGGLLCACAILTAFAGFRRLSVSSRDKLLLLMAEEITCKTWPNQALEPTSTAVTPPASAGDRASGSRGSP